MPTPVADMRVKSDTFDYIGPKANFPVGLLQVSGSSLHKRGVTLASGSTTNLATVDGDSVDISGNATISQFGTVIAGVKKWLRFTGAPILVHNATSLICVTGASIFCQANDRALVESLGSGNWIVLDFVRASGNSLVATTPFVTASVSGSINNFGPTGYNTSIGELRLTCSSAATLTGLTGGSADRTVIILNALQSSSELNFIANSGSSSVGNQFSFATAIVPGGVIRLRYNSGTAKWDFETFGRIVVNQTIGGNKATLNSDSLVITKDDGTTPALYFQWEDGLELATPLAVGSKLFIDLEGVVYRLRYLPALPGSFAVTQHNFSNWQTFTRLIASVAVDFTGLLRPDADPQASIIFLRNGGSLTITLKHQNIGSTDYNRLSCAGGVDIPLLQGETAIAIYDSVAQRWATSKPQNFDQVLNQASPVKFASLQDTAGANFSISNAYLISKGQIGCVQTTLADPFGAWMDYQSVNSPAFLLRTPLYTVALPATTGAMSVSVTAHVSTVHTLVPTGDCTLNISGSSVAGAKLKLVITTSSTTNYVMTFGTGFKSAGTLATGTVSGKTFSITFTYSGSTWVEDGRTGAM